MADDKKENELDCCECFQVHPDVLKTVNEQMPAEEELYDLAELFKVFGDSTRIRILFVLFEAEVCVCDLAQILGVTSRREGKSVFYSLADDHVRTIIGQGREHIEE